MKISKTISVILGVLGVLLVGFFVYGMITDCPNTAGYVSCSQPDRSSHL